MGASGSLMGELGGGGPDEQLDGCSYIMASTTVFLRLIEVREFKYLLSSKTY